KDKELDENMPASPKKSFPLAPAQVKKGIKNALIKREDRLAYNDVIFTEPLTPAPEEAPKPLVKGSVDTWFLLWSMILVCFGAVMSYSASAVYAEQKFDSSTYFLVRYIIFAVLAIAITVPFVVEARPWFWRIFGVGIYGVSIVLLLAVLVFGASEGEAQRWLDFGFFTIQPSEIAKMAVVMVLALYMSKYEKEITSKHAFGGSFKNGVLMPMVIIGVICGLVALERHISGLMIIGVLGVAVMFMGGTRIKWLAMFLGIIAVAGVFLILVSSYAQERVDIWLNIDNADPLGSAWQTLQGLYAIGSGGFFGLGLGSSRQKFGYVSQPQNDFIFTIICEELGFIGAFVVVGLFALLIWRGIKIGQHAPDRFCALVVWGLTFKIALQVAMNIAVVTNTMPNTGISLPFFSSGGTANMIQIFEIGIILSISRFSNAKK
ncbi:MAG: cell division protein FtsW, partial [Clostridia bacterium]|nr:cell division protein FtsW [Clostridia bacterium]